MGRDIDRGPELNEAYIARNVWRQKSRAAKKADYAANRAKPTRAKWARVKGFLLPFNVTGTGVLAEVEILETTQTGTGSNAADTARQLVSDFVFTTAQVPTNPAPTILPFPRYKFAKIITSTRTNQTGQDRQSRVTGLPYKQYQTYSASSPLGRDRTTPVGSTFSNVKAAIVAAAPYAAFLNGADGNRISILPEGD